MKRLFLSLLYTFAANIAVMAIPAYPYPVKLTMPDGRALTIVGHGDEYKSFITTIDGYTIRKANDQMYHYVTLEDGNLVVSSVVAHDPAERSLAESAFLTNVKPRLVPAEETTSIRRLTPRGVDSPNKAVMNLNNFKGLVILVNFTDRQFRLGDDMATYADDMMNKEGWTSYEYEGKTVKTTGSVHDYFSDNSYGQFKPNFDVVGPINCSFTSEGPDKHSNMYSILREVLNQANSQVDFSQYDANNDGVVDMMYFIFAGYASSFSGNNEKYLWPHASNLSYYYWSYDGKYMGRYACSTELYGLESQNSTSLNGIGTICHEFSHVLGYADHYDVDYGGHENPGAWDVMSDGSYNGNLSNCPAGYNAYERYSAGFMKPTLLSEDDYLKEFSMNDLESSPEAYMIKTPTNKEYFLLENRQRTKWDAQLPGHGMLVWRVDSTDNRYWTSNKVNSTNHLFFQLIRANGWHGDGHDGGADPFPGTKIVTQLTNTSSPSNLLSYRKYPSKIVLKGIKEDNKIVSFRVEDSEYTIPMPEGVLFHETFNECAGTGCNDGVFSVSAANASLIADNVGWTFVKEYGGFQCARLGTNTQRGSATTPEFSFDADKCYTLTFKLAPYYRDTPSVELSVVSGDALMTNDSIIDTQVPTNKLVLAMTPGRLREYSVTLKGSGKQRLCFMGAVRDAYRFYLDEVMLTEADPSTAILDIIVPFKPTDGTGGNRVGFFDSYNLSGQRVSPAYRGLVIKGGKKYISK